MHVAIRVKGHLDLVWQEWLEGLHMRHESDGTRVLIGQIQDQPALSGLLLTLTQLSISLLSLQSSEPMRRPYPEWHQPALRSVEMKVL